MQQIQEFIDSITVVKVVDIFIAIAIVILFKLFSGAVSYSIIKLFKLKVKSSREIKESAFYEPIKVFISILGVYVAFIFLKQPLQISQSVMNFITMALKIISVMAFAIGLARSFTPESTLVKKIFAKKNRSIEDTGLNFILKTIRVVIYIVAFLIVIIMLGIDINGLIAGLGLGGVIVTLAAQDTAKNLFGGFVIFLDKSFNVGDWIQIDNFEGTVEDMTFRSTRIRTFENSVVNIPNSIISNSSIINWSKMESRRYRFTLNISIDTPLEKLEIVQKRIATMLKKHDNIIDDSIIVKFDSIGTNSINLLICSYTDSVDYTSYLEEKEKINYKIIQILNEENVQFAYNTEMVFVKQ